MGSVILTTACIIEFLIALFELLEWKDIRFVYLWRPIASIAFALLNSFKHGNLGDVVFQNNYMLFYICGLLLLFRLFFQKTILNFDDALMAILGSIYIGFGFSTFLLSVLKGWGCM